MISVNHSVSGNQSIVSSGESFELGFFKPGSSKNYYLGIWYKNVITQTIVWVANREKSLSATDMNSVELKVLDGNLVLITESKNLFWSTNISNTISSNTLVAILSDDGNLMLSDGSNSTTLLWQSFDNPTDTWLPNAKVKYDKRTNTTKILTSWKNSEDPSPGIFSVEMDQSNKQFLIKWNRTELYSASGSWNGRILSLMPEMSLNSDRYSFTYVDNENESYFMYSLRNSSKIRLTLDVSGQIRHLIWAENLMEWQIFTSQPRQPCEVYASCGAFSICNKESTTFCNCLTGFTPKSNTEWDLNDHSGGCIRKESLQCGDGKKGRFLMNPNVTLPEYSISVPAASAEECHSTCLSNCSSCNAYAYDNNVCSIWNEVVNLKQLSPGDGSGSVIYTRLAVSDEAYGEDAKSGKFSLKLKVIISGVVAIAILLLCSFSYIYCSRMMAKKTASQQSTGGNPVPHWFNREKEAQNLINENDKQNIAVPFFCLENILAATDDFSDNKLGEGGFGPVFKGSLAEFGDVAIKRLSRRSSQGLEEFMNELKLIANLQHKNLVSLLGCCVEGEEKILIYEYMPNCSLDKFISDPSLKVTLDWDTRFGIIEGIAQGILYLHKYSRLKVIHRDLKVSNILLDQEMIPKISDFGMARIFGTDQTQASTKRVVGTYGYMSPEYVVYGQFSEKSDVFSFGVLLLEILTGERNSDFFMTEVCVSLLGWAWKMWKEGRMLELIDPSIRATCDSNKTTRSVLVALLCVQEIPTDRPIMSDIVVMLSNETTPIPEPKEPAFRSSWRHQKLNDVSINELTFTLPVPR
ncbi:hypothetical protein KY290_032977 [Solanum tuberosum]|uniref:Receptor-like serine/threonine-protein kinase n=1 Tax=Solanum tuberosum TaxID=4113 RepID=A0ABQ7UDS2_SOLTU|nr:hypothetical protein KY290_032977 [Solanum tuberosum]